MLFIILYKVVLRFESVDEILKYDHSNDLVNCKFKGRNCKSLSNFKLNLGKLVNK